MLYSLPILYQLVLLLPTFIPPLYYGTDAVYFALNFFFCLISGSHSCLVECFSFETDSVSYYVINDFILWNPVNNSGHGKWWGIVYYISSDIPPV